MPKKPGCDCEACATCVHRQYMREKRTQERFLRDIVWPNSRDWAAQARAEAEQLMRYVCPLLAVVGHAEGIIEREEKMRLGATNG